MFSRQSADQKPKVRRCRLGKSSLRRSNSWSGDTRWAFQVARHMKSHIFYDHEDQSFHYDVATGEFAIVAAEAAASMSQHGVPQKFPDLHDDKQALRATSLEKQLNALQKEHDALTWRTQGVSKDELYLKQAIENLKAQNNKLKISQRSLLDRKLRGGSWRFYVGIVIVSLLLVPSLFAITSSVADPVFRELMFPSTKQRGSSGNMKCSPRPQAESVVADEGMALPAWLSADWLQAANLSIPTTCSPHYPIVLRSGSAGTGKQLLEWLSGNRTAAKCFKQLALANGALLVRGLKEFSDQDFENVMTLLDLPPFAYTGSIGRREVVEKKSKRTFTTTYPTGMILMPHIEFGNKLTRPEFISFYAKSLPEDYGETPLVDFASVWEHMSSHLKLKFAQGIRFTTRLYPDYMWWVYGNYASTWKGAFNTEDPDAAMEQCKAMAGVRSCTWKWDGSLEYVNEFAALHFHEKRGGAAVLSATFGFWNSELPLQSLVRFANRLSFSERLHAYIFMRFKFAATYTDPTPTRATFLDGSQLTKAESKELSDLIWDNAVIYPAHEADMILIDNMGIAHGRMNVGGPIEKRKIVSYLGGSFSVPESVGVQMQFAL